MVPWGEKAVGRAFVNADDARQGRHPTPLRLSSGGICPLGGASSLVGGKLGNDVGNTTLGSA
jgi:hypothetical protein